MVQALFRLLAVLVAIRLFGSVARRFRRDKSRQKVNATDSDRVKKPDYRDLSPYEVEDADFEDIPK